MPLKFFGVSDPLIFAEVEMIGFPNATSNSSQKLCLGILSPIDQSDPIRLGAKFIPLG